VNNQIVRSAVTTFLVTFLGLIPVAAVVNSDFSWVSAALYAAALTTLRTCIAWIDPGNTAFGNGAVPSEATVQPDAPTEG
jgi:hypothetical protein